MTEQSTGQQAPPGRPAEAYAARYGLVRPQQGRYIAGVCGALGRATRTDPVLWRVLLPVLSCFSGVGALIYFTVWLFTPADGDTGSPVEAMLGRGHSRTSPLMVVPLAMLCGIIFPFLIPELMHVLLLAGTVLLAVLLLRERAGASPATPPAHPAAECPGDSTPDPAGEDQPTATTVAEPEPTTPSGAYRPPFAPHGPFAPAAPTPPPPPSPPPGPIPPPRPYPPPHGPFPPPARPYPPPQKVARERSPLALFTLLAALLVLAGLGALDLSGAVDVPLAGYAVAALGTVGCGLMVGAWLGRGRSLIIVGMVLALVALPAAHLIDRFQPPEHFATSVIWAPTTAAEVRDEYGLTVGRGVLDLRSVEFPDGETTLTVRVTAGEMLVHVPPEVNVRTEVDVRAGDAVLFGHRVGGPNTTFDSPGTEGSDGPTIRLKAVVQLGYLEVTR